MHFAIRAKIVHCSSQAITVLNVDSSINLYCPGRGVVEGRAVIIGKFGGSLANLTGELRVNECITHELGFKPIFY